MYIKHALQGQQTCDSIDISIKKKIDSTIFA